MKRIIAAVSFAVLAAPAFAADRSAPYEETQFNRGVSVEQSASSGSSAAASGVWAQDHNFIAPAQ